MKNQDNLSSSVASKRLAIDWDLEIAQKLYVDKRAVLSLRCSGIDRFTRRKTRENLRMLHELSVTVTLPLLGFGNITTPLTCLFSVGGLRAQSCVRYSAKPRHMVFCPVALCLQDEVGGQKCTL
jgi:hypothetical protein